MGRRKSYSVVQGHSRGVKSMGRQLVICIDPPTLSNKLKKDRSYYISEPEKKTGLVSVYTRQGKYICMSYQHRFKAQ